MGLRRRLPKATRAANGGHVDPAGFTLIEPLDADVVGARGKLRGVRQRGFTLIELLVVIAIIAVLVTMLLPSLQQSKALARLTICQANLYHIFLAVNMYADDYDDWYPPYTQDGYGSRRQSMKPLEPYVNVDEGEHYDETGPLKPSLYFCPAFMLRFERHGPAGNPAFGYAVNHHYIRYHHFQNQTFKGTPRSDIPSPDFTVFLKGMNPPFSHDAWIDGVGLWPLNPQHGYPSRHSHKYSRVHMNGQTVLFFDGHSEYYTWPNAVKCQVYPGWDYTSYGGWQWN